MWQCTKSTHQLPDPMLTHAKSLQALTVVEAYRGRLQGTHTTTQQTPQSGRQTAGEHILRTMGTHVKLHKCCQGFEVT